MRDLRDSFRSISERATKVSFPGFDRIPIYDVITFFLKGLRNGALTTRATSIAFHFFLAFPPAIIFFYTLIPYLPIENFRSGLSNLTASVMPNDVNLLIGSLLEDMLVKKKAINLLGLLVSVIFAMNGMDGMIVAFNATYHGVETRRWLERRLIALLMVIILFTMINTATVLIIFSNLIVDKLVMFQVMRIGLTYYVLHIGKWVIILALIFSAISFLYYFAPSRKTGWRFYSPGSTLAALLVILTSLGFSAFINSFGRFNEFFGSMGTLMVIMIWLYLNSLALLIGFELNASIMNAKPDNHNDVRPEVPGA